jgi:chemotaxis signal transduction protein
VTGQEAAVGAREGMRLLHFRSAGERFTLDVSFVREIVPVLEGRFVPGTGVINHRGASS